LIAVGLLTRPLLWGLFVLGCGRTLRPQAPVADDPLQVARERPVPPKVQGKFSFTFRSGEDFDVSTGGVVILDRPGRGHLAVLGPLGGPLATLQTSEGGAAVSLARQQHHFVAEDAESVLRETTSGLVGVDDLLGLFVGDLPMDEAPTLTRHVREDGLLEVVLDGPDATTLVLEVDPSSATPRRLRAMDADQKVMLDAKYAPFELQQLSAEPVGTWMPTDLDLSLPGMGLQLELHMKSWTVPDPMPEVFGLAAPQGFNSSPLEEAIRMWGARFLAPPSDRMEESEEGG
jgi:outer membrane biogenesis lipoprotein LolB